MPRNHAKRVDDHIEPYIAPSRHVGVLRHGSSRCRCAGCGDGFNSVSAFDMHQRLKSDGRPVCLDPASLGMVRNEAGWWMTSRQGDVHWEEA